MIDADKSKNNSTTHRKRKTGPKIFAKATIRLWGELIGMVMEYENGRIGFSYDSDYLRNGGLAISPKFLPLEARTFEFSDLQRQAAFMGLPGVLADSLPDTFGNLIIKKYYEEFHKVKIKDDALQAAIKLSVKYQTDKKLPDKAIDLIDVACSRFNLKLADTRVIGEAEIQHELARMIQMPEEQIAETESGSLSNLENQMKQEVYGQDSAITEIVDKILVARAGLKADNKPVGSFVFMGPTGTGKTETAKALAKHLGTKLVRFDMSEYQEKHSVSKLIGSPPGYVGFEENAGLLITKIQESPNCVLLLDEIEKSHPDVSTILLQMMDNGFITGSNGKQADCRNLILIITTNAGASEADKNRIGFAAQEQTYSDAALKKFFAPEFRNRLDATVTFGKLTKETMIKIVGKFMVELKDQIKDKGIRVKISDDAIDWLIEKGFDAKMGARPLQRTIDKEIKRPLARLMLFGDLKNGGSLNVTVKNDVIELITKPKVQKVAVVSETIQVNQD